MFFSVQLFGMGSICSNVGKAVREFLMSPEERQEKRRQEEEERQEKRRQEESILRHQARRDLWEQELYTEKVKPDGLLHDAHGLIMDRLDNG